MTVDALSQPYEGEEKIVVGIDLGTTHSAVSFSHLCPNQVIDVRMVNKWEGQPEDRGDSKIPSIVAYQNGQAVAFGAEARDLVGNPSYDIAHWFKLHLHPQTMASGNRQFQIPPLPHGVPLEKVYAEFMGYLFRHAQDFFQKTTVNGAGIWSRLRSSIVIVLAIPNGWDTIQQGFLRNVAIQGGLISQDDAELRLEFVTESEASVHFALARTRTQTWLRKGSMFMVTDAGGSTVDSVLYECDAATPSLVLKEVCASECVQAGGVFVDRAAQAMLEAKLVDSRFSDPQIIEDMVDAFEKRTKRVFDGSQEANMLAFGGRRDNDRLHNILQGRLTLSRDEVASTFDVVVKRIVDSCLSLLRGRKIQYLLLVGGFGDSPFLRKRLDEIFKGQGTDVVIVDEPSKKAAAEGSIMWITKQLVVARAARFTIGTDIYNRYRETNPEHVRRKALTFVGEDGYIQMGNQYSIMVEKDHVMKQNFQETLVLGRQYDTKPKDLGKFKLDLLAWSGDATTKWTVDTDGGKLPGIRRLCTLTADLSRLTHSLTVKTGLNGKRYWRVPVQILIAFGGTQLRARLQWEEEGKLCDGPVSIITGSIC